MTIILGNYIDGRWMEPRAGATFEKRNQADELDWRREIAAALTREEGKSAVEANGETARGVMILRYFIGTLENSVAGDS